MPRTEAAFQATTSATQMIASAAGGPEARRHAVTVRNLGPNRIYIGTSNTVTTATGFPIDPGAAKTWDKEANSAFFVIADTANQVSPNDTRYTIEYGVGS